MNLHKKEINLKAKHLWLTDEDRVALKKLRKNIGSISDSATIRTAIHIASKNLGDVSE